MTRKIVLDKLYNPTDYPTYDNYPAIEVSKSKDIPVDFLGLMGVPITAMSLPGFQKAFELVGLSGHNGFPPFKLNGKNTYRRLIIRRRTYTPTEIFMTNKGITQKEEVKDETTNTD